MSNLCGLNNKHLLKFISDFCLKPVCILCEQSLSHYQRICAACALQLPWTDNACRQCAQPLGVSHIQCGSCQKNPPPFDRLWVALDYASPVDRLVLGGKFSQRLSYLSLLAELFIMYWQKQSAPLPDIIIPVPLHARRLRERGYNQALELARIIGRHLQVPIDFCSIKRTKTTLAQASLPASQRRENISDAFACTSPITYSRVALVDDVLTTGNTVRALSQTLRQAGVAHIDVYCIARTLHL